MIVFCFLLNNIMIVSCFLLNNTIMIYSFFLKFIFIVCYYSHGLLIGEEERWPSLDISFDPLAGKPAMAFVISKPVQGYLTYKKTYPPRTLPEASASGPGGVLGGWAFSYGRGTPVRSLHVPRGFRTTIIIIGWMHRVTRGPLLSKPWTLKLWKDVAGHS